MTPAKIRFLITLASAIRNGAVKTIKQAIGFAKREFDEIDTEFTNRIINVFKKEGKTKKGDVVPIKKQETKDIRQTIDEKEGDDFIDFVRKQGDEEGANKIQKEVDRLNKAIEDADKRVAAKEALEKRTADIKKGDVEGTGVESLGTSMKNLKKKVDELKKVSQDTTPEGIMNEILKGQRVMAENYKTGNIRTAVRQFMRTEADAGRLKLRKWDDEALKVYGQTTESDPIQIFRRYYGEDALEAVDKIGDVFRQGESFKHYEQLLRENVDPKILTPKTKGLGEYDPNVLTPQQENELRKQLLKEQDQKKMLEDFDPTDRTKNADGGIIGNLHLNRTGFDSGGSPLQRMKQALVDSITVKVPGIPESDLQIIVKDITLDMSPEQAQASVKANFMKLYGYVEGGRVQAASGGLINILKL